MAVGDGQVAMHAVLAKSDASLNSKREATYKLAFEYAQPFVEEVDSVLGEEVDVYWNEDLIALNAVVTGARQRPVKDEDPVRIVTLQADPGDLSRKMVQIDVGTAGDLRLRVTQMALALKS